MKFSSFDTILRLAIVNFFIFLAIIIYLNQQTPRIQPAIQISPLPQPEIQTTPPATKLQESSPSQTQTPPEVIPKIPQSPPPTPQPKQLTPLEEVASHATKSDCWVVYQDHIYNITGYFGSHPGGDETMLPYCGKDMTVAFDTKDKSPGKPHSQTALNLLQQFWVK